MIEHLKALGKVVAAIEAERGPFVLFGVFMREDSSGRWDLVVSAPWLEEGKLKALGEFVQTLAKGIGEEEVLSFSRIVTLNRDDFALHAVLDGVAGARLPLHKEGPGLFGLPLEHAHVLRAQQPLPNRQPTPPTKRKRCG
jgi:hypothetical protein